MGIFMLKASAFFGFWPANWSARQDGDPEATDVRLVLVANELDVYGSTTLTCLMPFT